MAFLVRPSQPNYAICCPRKRTNIKFPIGISKQTTMNDSECKWGMSSSVNFYQKIFKFYTKIEPKKGIFLVVKQSVNENLMLYVYARMSVDVLLHFLKTCLRLEIDFFCVYVFTGWPRGNGGISNAGNPF
jgi:hypothetical protein